MPESLVPCPSRGCNSLCPEGVLWNHLKEKHSCFVALGRSVTFAATFAQGQQKSYLYCGRNFFVEKIAVPLNNDKELKVIVSVQVIGSKEAALEYVYQVELLPIGNVCVKQFSFQNITSFLDDKTTSFRFYCGHTQGKLYFDGHPNPIVSFKVTLKETSPHALHVSERMSFHSQVRHYFRVCKYVAKGCPYIGNAGNNHENSCPFGEVRCFYPSCVSDRQLNLFNICEHVRTAHSEKFLMDAQLSFIISSQNCGIGHNVFLWNFNNTCIKILLKYPKDMVFVALQFLQPIETVHGLQKYVVTITPSQQEEPVYKKTTLFSLRNSRKLS